MENNLSPEEKLFKVIKEGVAPPANGAAGAMSSPDSSTENIKLKQSPSLSAATDTKLSPSGLGAVASAAPIALPQTPPKAKSAEPAVSSSPSSRWGSFKRATRALATRYASGAQYLAMFQRIEVINRLLAIVLVLLLGTFIYSTVLGRPSIEKTILNFPRPPTRSLEADQQAAFMSADEYMKMVRQRNIFSREQQPIVKNIAVTDKTDIPRIKTDLQLVGIFFDPNPEVIIEDKVEKKTYFLKEGDNIKGIKIKRIQEDRVILESNGVEQELM